MHVTTQDYGQFLVNSVKNFTGTHFAETIKGLEHDTVMGIGTVNRVYYNPELDRYWIIDSRIY